MDDRIKTANGIIKWLEERQNAALYSDNCCETIEELINEIKDYIEHDRKFPWEAEK